jgi:hypothetical protein
MNIMKIRIPYDKVGRMTNSILTTKLYGYERKRETISCCFAKFEMGKGFKSSLSCYKKEDELPTLEVIPLCY